MQSTRWRQCKQRLYSIEAVFWCAYITKGALTVERQSCDYSWIHFPFFLNWVTKYKVCPKLREYSSTQTSLLLLSFYRQLTWKVRSVVEAHLFPEGTAVVQLAVMVQSVSKGIGDLSLYCALWDRQGCGQRAKTPNWVTDTCGLLGKCHTSGSHTARDAAWRKERRQKETESGTLGVLSSS